jgi:hypothetical protein
VAKISNDVPIFIMDMLYNVDYSRITDADYNKWIHLIKSNIGKHLKLKTKPISFIELDLPIRQDLCDLINRYDFSSIPPLQQAMVRPFAIRWSNKNLPLLKKI